MKNSNVLKNNCSHNSDISIGYCDLLINQAEKIKYALVVQEGFSPYSENFDFIKGYIDTCLDKIDFALSNLKTCCHE